MFSFKRSTFTDDKTKARAAPVQPLGWLAKPYDQEDMVQAVAEALQRARATAAKH